MGDDSSQREEFHTDRIEPSNRRIKIGIYGWRKSCLYLLMIVLIFITAFNFYTTLWIIGCLRINSEGMGVMKIFDTGIIINGIAYFMNGLVTSKIQSQSGIPLSIVTSEKFTISIRDPAGKEISKFLLSNEAVEFITNSFSVKNDQGSNLFSVDSESVTYGVKQIKINGNAGAFVNEVIQTPLVKGHFKKDLSLVSIHNKVEVIGSSGVLLKAFAGDISFSSLNGVKIKTTEGAIRMDSRKIFMPNLPIAKRINTSCDNNAFTSAATSRETTEEDEEKKSQQQLELEKYYSKHLEIPAKAIDPQTVYQVCMCANGKVFLAAANGKCVTDDENAICH